MMREDDEIPTQRLCARINHYWLNKVGRSPNARPELFHIQRASNISILWGIRSDLVNGLPPK